MKSIDGVFTWEDFHLDNLFAHWRALGIKPPGLVYCKSQPRLSYIAYSSGADTPDNLYVQGAKTRL